MDHRHSISSSDQSRDAPNGVQAESQEVESETSMIERQLSGSVVAETSVIGEEEYDDMDEEETIREERDTFAGRREPSLVCLKLSYYLSTPNISTDA